MSNAFEAIKEGLNDAIAYARGETDRGKAHQVEVPHVDVRALRRRLGMSQNEFAVAFGVNAGTVRNWEQGRRRPEGPARVLLLVIEREPELVQRALAG